MGTSSSAWATTGDIAVTGPTSEHRDVDGRASTNRSGFVVAGRL